MKIVLKSLKYAYLEFLKLSIVSHSSDAILKYYSFTGFGNILLNNVVLLKNFIRFYKNEKGIKSLKYAYLKFLKLSIVSRSSDNIWKCYSSSGFENILLKAVAKIKREAIKLFILFSKN